MKYKKPNYLTEIEMLESLVVFNSYLKTFYEFRKNTPEAKIFLSNDSVFEIDSIENPLVKNNLLVPENYNDKEQVELYKLDSIYQNRLVIVIIPTMKCNFNCSYCYESNRQNQMSEATINSVITYISLAAPKYEEIHIIWYGGEPLEAIEIIEKISKSTLEICNNTYTKYYSSIISNGYNLTKRNFEMLLNLKVTNFHITLDGNQREHDELRVHKTGIGTFEKIVNNLVEIKSINGRFSISIRSNINVTNINKLECFTQFLHNNFNDDNRFGFYFRPVGKWNNEIGCNRESLISYKKIINHLLESKVRLNYFPYYNLLLNSICQANKRYYNIIGYNGIVYKCLLFIDDASSAVGKLHSNGTITYDNGKIAKWILPDQLINCDKCNFLPSCFSKACPANGILYHATQYCPNEKQYLSQTIKLLYKNESLPIIKIS